MLNKIAGIVALLTITSVAVAGQTAESEHRVQPKYTLASLEGSYAVVAVYGAHVAGLLGTTTYNGEGEFTSTYLINEPGPGPSPSRVLVPLNGVTGTSTINPDGTGTFTIHGVFPDGTSVTVHQDFVVTEARIVGQKIVATRIKTMGKEPSGIPNADFVTATLTRRPG